MSSLDGPLAKLNALYDALPTIGCKGLCEDSCGPIAMSNTEDLAISAAGVDIPDHETAVRAMAEANGEYRCPALVDGRCSVYDKRPMICRMWGVMESLPCPYGCEPDPGYLSDVTGMVLLGRSLLVGGDPAGLVTSEEDIHRMTEVASSPEFREFIAEFMEPWRSKAGPHANVRSQQQAASSSSAGSSDSPKDG